MALGAELDIQTYANLHLAIVQQNMRSGANNTSNYNLGRA